MDEESAEKDRKSSLTAQLEWLTEAGLRSVDYICHLWMEHFVICNDVPKRAARAVREHTRQPNAGVRAASLCALADKPPSFADSGYIVHALRDVSPVVRLAGVYLLTQRSDLWSKCRECLADWFDDLSLDVRIESLHLARKMAYPDFAEKIATGLDEDARLGRIANFTARRDALEAITGQQLPARPQLNSGNPRRLMH